VVTSVAGLGARSLLLDGELAAVTADGRTSMGLGRSPDATVAYFGWSGAIRQPIARRDKLRKGPADHPRDKFPGVLARSTFRAAETPARFSANRQSSRTERNVMAYEVDFTNVSTIGLESSPVANALAGLRANEARYFKNKYSHVFAVEPASNAQETIDWVHRILKEERDLVIESRPLEATAFQVENIRIAYVFYESGLSINVMYTIDDKKKRAVGFKLSDGMDVPAELASRFKFARQKSKLAGTIRGSFFVIKGEH
jgi:hypothetical protein